MNIIATVVVTGVTPAVTVVAATYAAGYGSAVTNWILEQIDQVAVPVTVSYSIPFLIMNDCKADLK